MRRLSASLTVAAPRLLDAQKVFCILMNFCVIGGVTNHFSTRTKRLCGFLAHNWRILADFWPIFSCPPLANAQNSAISPLVCNCVRHGVRPHNLANANGPSPRMMARGRDIECWFECSSHTAPHIKHQTSCSSGKRRRETFELDSWITSNSYRAPNISTSATISFVAAH